MSRRILNLRAPNFLHLIRTTGLRQVVVALFLALQGVLAFHHLEHDLTDHLGGPEHACVLCQSAAHALPAPAPTVVKLPEVSFIQPTVLPEAVVVVRVAITGFRSRAPPTLFSA